VGHARPWRRLRDVGSDAVTVDQEAVARNIVVSCALLGTGGYDRLDAERTAKLVRCDGVARPAATTSRPRADSRARLAPDRRCDSRPRRYRRRGCWKRSAGWRHPVRRNERSPAGGPRLVREPDRAATPLTHNTEVGVNRVDRNADWAAPGWIYLVAALVRPFGVLRVAETRVAPAVNIRRRWLSTSKGEHRRSLL
jgi:hypothetical protein